MEGCDVTECKNDYIPFTGWKFKWELGEFGFEEPLAEATIESPVTYGNPIGNGKPEWIPLVPGKTYVAYLVRSVEVDDETYPIVSQTGCVVFVAP